MKNWINKHFKRSTSVKIYIVHEDKRVTVHYEVPKGDQVTIGDRSYLITNKEALLSKGRPSFFYHYNTPNPINPFELQKPGMTAKEFNTAITANVAKQIFAASESSLDVGKIAMILSGITLLSVIVVGYMMFDKIDQFAERLSEIREILRVIGGV